MLGLTVYTGFKRVLVVSLFAIHSLVKILTEIVEFMKIDITK